MLRSAALVALLVGGSAAIAGAERQQVTFRSSAVGVRADVLVTDGRKPVAGLTAGDFELRDQGVLQSVSLVDAEAVPVNVVLTLDASASTTGTRLSDLTSAARSLLSELKPNDQAALTTFNHAVTPLVPLTGNLPLISQQLTKISSWGRTAVLDAIYVALTTTLSQSGRSLVVVYTDGSDVSSWLNQPAVVASAARSNAVVYAVTTNTVMRDREALDAIADATGGAVLRISRTDELRDTFRAILNEFRSRYILAYTPTGVPPGGFHQISVRTKRRGLTVKARPGYTGTSAGQQ